MEVCPDQELDLVWFPTNTSMDDGIFEPFRFPFWTLSRSYGRELIRFVDVGDESYIGLDFGLSWFRSFRQCWDGLVVSLLA